MALLLRGEFDLCTGCGACLLACSSRAVKGYSPRFARLKVTMEQEGLVNRPVLCTQCKKPFCLRACPFEAIYKDKKTGWILINKELCTSCGQCLEACPDEMIFFSIDGKADKCDMCNGDPQCIKFCTPKALNLVQVCEGGMG
ncbi:MAG: hypothetical protein VR72_10050 [Clostridiaceae bacterium BRH_c20a]|nr:MAG: hypothetical protein VR72_10050 [Clostridiaceae bacterium BRH_c20a]